MPWGDVVFYGVLELALAESKAGYPLYLVVGQGSGQDTGQYGIFIEPKLINPAILLNLLTNGHFQIFLHADHIKSGTTEGNPIIVQWHRVQKITINTLPQCIILKFVLSTRNAVIQLNICVEFIVIVHGMDCLVDIVYFRGEEIVFCAFCALPEKNRTIFGVLSYYP